MQSSKKVQLSPGSVPEQQRQREQQREQQQQQQQQQQKQLPESSLKTASMKSQEETKTTVSSFPPSLMWQYHEPPSGEVDYKDNPSVFGKVLRGELPARTLMETSSLLAFQDRTPRAPLHALVIPKRYIRTICDLSPVVDVPLVEEMQTMAMALIETYHPQALATKDYILCYHVPPFNSVNHLHLHVLAPASKMKFMFRYGKYLVGTAWCTSQIVVLERLKDGKKAV